MYKPESDFEKNASKVASGIGKFGRRLGRGLKNTGARALRGILPQNVLKRKFKTILFICLFVIFVIFGTMFIAFYETDENIGETENLVDYGNSVKYNEDGKIEVDEYSPANSACLEYFKILSRNKSTWQLITDENGEEILIRETDERAKQDYFKNDESFILDPYFLYSITNMVYEDTYVYPEAFLQPVAYNKDDYTLKNLKDEDGNCLVLSSGINDEGHIKETKNSQDVSDYGLSTILIYDKKPKTVTLDYSYISEVKMTATGLQEVVYDKPEQHSVVQSSTEETVLVKAITFAGEITYEYDTTYACLQNCSGTGSEEENVERVYIGEETVECYYAVPMYGSATEDRIKYALDPYYLYTTYCQNGGYFMPEKENYEEATSTDATPTGDAMKDAFNASKYKTTSYTYKKYKTRSKNSGLYETFCRNSNRVTDDKGSQYLYDYLGMFTAKAPVVERSYDTFREFNSSANGNNSFLIVNSGESSNNGGGYNGYQSYSATQVENAKKIWDGCIQWGYTEEQASAVLGNVFKESSFNFGSIEGNSIGHGICQWSYGRYDGATNSLLAFAKAKNKEWTDEETQIQFLCMELDTKNVYPYAGCQWGSSQLVLGNHGFGEAESRRLWEDKNTSIEILTTIMCENWERPRVSNASARVQVAMDFYTLFSGSETKYTYAVIEPSSKKENTDGENTTIFVDSQGFNEEDEKAFYDFYHAIDEKEGEKLEYTLYQKFLSSDEVDEIIYMTNSFLENTTLSEQSIYDISDNLWSSGFLTRLSSERNDREGYLVRGDIDFILPTLSDVNSLTSVYGPRDIKELPSASKEHKGIDMGAPMDAPILAVMSGTVTQAGYESSMGNYVILEATTENGDHLKFTYMHNNKLNVSTGEQVTQGTIISYNGSTGNSTGPHCHLALEVNGVSYNPLLYCYGESIDKMPAINKDTGEVEYIKLNVLADSSLQTWDYYMYYDATKGEYIESGLGSLK